MKVCKLCGEQKPVSEFESYKLKERLVIRNQCRVCRCARVREARRLPGGTDREKRSHAKRKAERASGQRTELWILYDSRKSDRKHGRPNNLTLDFVRATISQGCWYCGETELRMTLDRVDNSEGHLMSNVVPACIRCNYTRKDMPYEAWWVVAEGMRAAREAGLFGPWTGRVR